MRTIDLFLISAMIVILSGCSSPPEPVQPEWDKPGVEMNTTRPQWSENRVILPSPTVDDHWSIKMAFNPDAVYPPDVWYAVVHSSQIIVNAPDSERYFRAKTWLRKNGYSGVITFLPKLNNCLTCNTTEIEFYR
ncbi:type IV secretion system Cag12-like protein|uniref:Type IV secretion system Cag12-like protein n=1 Tax=Brenneria salicis ATCC 15712 = DSM 30166 TaxID=714314 RepID=A0A366I354_9GAMM|nr:cag pathogenicity island Cag12 family protein [Brenneria salicis]NMN92907.1 type IV secretion system Cag12-like protein [Brenneria salicis ATCC 15712 = DSM 30166]RBP60975.1 type IV secretion system Cag12-like protein [Brenneria salicis ATCC 15712 = DSM 30166]RLM29758.1 hypothetical protein BHG07_14470 [Brenneria salicis ATCC 15712 = DSM 30166]